MIATETLLISLPDGDTLLQTGDGLVLQTITKRVPIDVMQEFEPVVSSTAQPYILVGSLGIAATSNRELVEGIAAPQMTQRLAIDGTKPAERMKPKELRQDLERISQDFEQQVKDLGIKF